MMTLPPPTLPNNNAIRRILVIKWSALGDIAIASAIFEDIYRAFPDREIDLNILPPWDGLFRNDPRFQRIFAINLRDRRYPVSASWKWLRHVRRMSYDLIIDLQSNDRSRLLLIALAISRRRALYLIGNRLRFPYNIGPEGLSNQTHALERMRAALMAGGIPTQTSRPILYIPNRNRERSHKLQQFHALDPGRYVVLMPGCKAAGYLKRWGAERYAALARRLHSDGIDKIVLIGGKDEWEDCSAIERACGPWLVNLCGQTEIFDIVPLCEGARLIVSNDTGTAHIAAAADKPMMVLCGPTNPRRVKPLGDNVVALQADLPCINCYRKHCSHHSCMTMLTPPLVYQHLRQSLQLNHQPTENESKTDKT